MPRGPGAGKEIQDQRVSLRVRLDDATQEGEGLLAVLEDDAAFIGKARSVGLDVQPQVARVRR
jgi:hypothetical protein